VRSARGGRCNSRAIGAIAAVALAAAAGCAAPPPRPAYEGVLTGEIVDGRPLVRFPAIEVVGKRSDAASLD
jgi:hypothetical protein